MAVYFLLFFLFLADIFNYFNPLKISFFIVTVFPAIYLLYSLIRKGEIKLPKSSIYYLVFLGISFLSIIVAPDKQEAYETSLVYSGVFFVFLIAFNARDRLLKSFNRYVFVSTLAFLGIFAVNELFKLNLFTKGTSIFYYYGHNQLGNLLILPFLALFPRVSSFFLLVFVFLSYSRVTYLSLSIVLAWQMRNFFKKKLVAGIVVVVALLFFGVFITGNKVFSRVKTTLGSREMYFSYALNTIVKRPVLGVGSGNFYYSASSQQTNYNENTISSHNILLDIMAENGIVAGLSFLAFLIFLIRYGRKNTYFYSFLALTIVFMLDFTHKYHSFLALWLFLAGLMVEEKETFSLRTWPMFLFIVLLQPAILGQTLFNLGLYKSAISVYPIHKEAYASAIVEAIDMKDNKTAKSYLDRFEKLYSEDFTSTLRIARYNEILDDYKKALFFYRHTLKLRPFFWVANRVVADRMVVMDRLVFGQFKGRESSGEYIGELMGTLPRDPRKNYLIYDSMQDFCEENKLKCYNVKNH